MPQERPSRRTEPTEYAGRACDGHAVRNTILLRIPDDEFRLLQPHLKFIDLQNAVCLQQEGGRINSVYFLNCGIGSIIVETPERKSVEVGVTGHEGMVGLPLAAGLEEFTHSVVVQVPGDGFRVKGPVLKRLLPSMPVLKGLLLRRLAIRSHEHAQNAACNRLHNVKQRLARWLLSTHDRIDSDIIRTTHDFLSKLVGTDRPSVTIAVAELERAGIIRGGRASISINDRRKLENQSCKCYSVFKLFNAELGLRSS